MTEPGGRANQFRSEAKKGPSLRERAFRLQAARSNSKRKLILLLSLIAVVAGWLNRDTVLIALTTFGNAMAWGAAIAALAVFCLVTVVTVRFLARRFPKWIVWICRVFLVVVNLYLGLSLVSAPICDPVIDARLKTLPPREGLAFYVIHNGQPERIAVPADRRISAEEARDSALRVIVPRIEDERFDTRPWGPIDPEALLRAAVRTLIFGQREGGSTILVQTAKLIQGKTKSNWSDKPWQFLIAMRLNQRFPSGDEQMALYLNLAPMPGDHNLAYTAADLFGVPDLRELKMTDPRGVLAGATLAGMIKAPGAFNPRKNYEKSRDRRNVVLRKLDEGGLVKDAAWLKEQPVELHPAVFTRNLSFYVRAAERRRI